MRFVLAFDCATTIAVVALGATTGRLVEEESWTAGYRHGEELLARIDRLLGRRAIALDDLSAVIVGTGPGAFTGLRVAIATAKGIAHACRIPIVGVATSAAILRAASEVDPVPGPLALLLPAGPSDRVLVTDGSSRLLPGGVEPSLRPVVGIVALDLPGRAPADALTRGEQARAGLGAALVEIGARRLSAGQADDLAALVPEYVTLPRGVHAQTGEIEWSLDRR